MTSITDYQQQSQSQPKQTWGYLEQEGRWEFQCLASTNAPPFSLSEWLPTDGETTEESASTLLFLATSHHLLQGNYSTNIPKGIPGNLRVPSLVELCGWTHKT